MTTDGSVTISIITNAKEATKALNDTSKAFNKTGRSAENVTTVFNSLQNGVNKNIEALREMALGGGQNSKEFQRLAQQTREYQRAINDANSAVNSAIGGQEQQVNMTNKLAGAVKGLVGAYLGIQGIRMVINYSAEAVAAFRQQDIAIKQLNQTLQNAGVYSYEYSTELQNLASEIQRYSNFGDEAVIKAQALGQSYIGNTRLTKELTKATVDFASATGMDLEQAFTLVGKSIGSQTNALGRYGVELKKGMTDAEKMEAIQKQLGARYEGTAKQMADSSIQLKNALGDLSEAFGRVLNPAVQNTQKVMTGVVIRMTELINKVRILKSDINSLDLQESQTRYKQTLTLLNKLDEKKAKQGFLSGPEQGKYYQAVKDLMQVEAHMDNLFKQQRELKKLSATTGGIKINDDYGAMMPPTPTSNVVSIKQGKAKQEAQKQEIAKIVEQKGAYQQLNDKITELTTKLRDLAAEQQVNSADWVNYKTQLQAAKTELDAVNKSLEDNGINVEEASKKISSTLSTGLVNALRNGGNAFEMFSNLATTALQKILDKLIEMAFVTPILNALSAGTGGGILGSLFSFFGFKNGAAFKNGNVIPFARGGIVNKPTLFPMANGGTGLMGEAGAEAVMPLKRMANGRLGVESDGGNAVQVNIYNQSNSKIETRKRDDGSMDIIVKRVNEALMNERTSSGFRAAYQREDRKGVQAV